MAISAILGAILPNVFKTVDKIIPDKDLAKKLNHELELAVLSSENEVAIAKEETQQEIERTHQVEMNQSDIKTKRTRPEIARESWRLGVGYALLCFGCSALQEEPKLVFDVYIFGTIVTPALWYMGMRSVDKFRGHR